MSEELKISDVVVLNGTGVQMTITETPQMLMTGEVLFRCVWFDVEKHLQSHVFKGEVLRKLK